MKKVGILNFQYSKHNYGAVLQAAALEHICRMLGHDAAHIDFMATPNFSLKERVHQLLRKLGLRKRSEPIQVANEEAFERFRNSFITRTPRIRSREEFEAASRHFDATIVGSDQVWRPGFAKDTMAFFLGYVHEGVPRIAYAASFGTATWQLESDTSITEKVRDELKKFKAISCREDSGVRICVDVFEVAAEHVLDPLLLVDDTFFGRVLSHAIDLPSAKLIYYKLDTTSEFQEDLNAISAELGSEAVNAYLKESTVCEFREVPDWLALIWSAETVLTDSFHCICLALRFGKKVIYCPNDKRGKARLDSLFKKLNVEEQPLGLDLKTPMFTLTGRGDIHAILDSERSRSMVFLADALHD